MHEYELVGFLAVYLVDLVIDELPDVLGAVDFHLGRVGPARQHPYVDLDVLDCELGEVDDVDYGVGFEQELAAVVGQQFAAQVEVDLVLVEGLGGRCLAVEFGGGEGGREVEDCAVLLGVADVDFGELRHVQ